MPRSSELAVALTEMGEGFAIGCSYGTAIVPLDAADSESALRMADQRLYSQKRAHRQCAEPPPDDEPHAMAVDRAGLADAA